MVVACGDDDGSDLHPPGRGEDAHDSGILEIDARDVIGFDTEAAPDADATADDAAETEVASEVLETETVQDALEDTDTTDTLEDEDALEDEDEDANEDEDALEVEDEDALEVEVEIENEIEIEETESETAEETEEDTVASCPLGPELHDEIWGDLDPLTETALRTELKDLIDDHVGQDYDAARDLMYVTADIDVNADGFIECIYTGTLVHEDGTRSPGVITTEHSWPRSDGAATFPAEGDIHHLFPATDASNNRRSNDEYGETTCGHTGQSACAWQEGGSFSGPATDGRSRVFEVRPQYRGDVARAHFYFAVRYGLQIPPLEEAVLRKWHVDDPPDDVERARNDRIALWLLNRNPFVDQPCMLDRISDY